MLLLTVIGFGHKAGNAYRWLNLGPVNVQPAEVAKLGVVTWLAYSLSKKAERIQSFPVGFLPALPVVGRALRVVHGGASVPEGTAGRPPEAVQRLRGARRR